MRPQAPVSTARRAALTAASTSAATAASMRAKGWPVAGARTSMVRPLSEARHWLSMRMPVLAMKSPFAPRPAYNNRERHWKWRYPNSRSNFCMIVASTASDKLALRTTAADVLGDSFEAEHNVTIPRNRRAHRDAVGPARAKGVFSTTSLVLFSEAQTFQKQAEGLRWLPPAGVIEVVAVERLAPVFKDTDQSSFGQQRCCPVLNQERDAVSCDGGSQDKFDIVERQLALYLDLQLRSRPSRTPKRRCSGSPSGD